MEQAVDVMMTSEVKDDEAGWRHTVNQRSPNFMKLTSPLFSSMFIIVYQHANFHIISERYPVKKNPIKITTVTHY